MPRSRNIGRTKIVRQIRDWEQEEFGSRTEIKDAAKAVTELGEYLSKLTEKEIKKLNFPTLFEDAVLMLKNMEKGPALKRQKLFVGKFLRQDEELLIKIKAQLESISIKSKQQNAHFYRLEKLRDRLINEGDVALNEFIIQFQPTNVSQLRQWIRNAQKEAKQEKTIKSDKSSKLIFKYLKTLAW